MLRACAAAQRTTIQRQAASYLSCAGCLRIAATAKMRHESGFVLCPVLIGAHAHSVEHPSCTYLHLAACLCKWI